MIIWEYHDDKVQLIYEDGYWYFQFTDDGRKLPPTYLKDILETLLFVGYGVIK